VANALAGVGLGMSVVEAFCFQEVWKKLLEEKQK
jgi:hypothetical protein